MITSVHLTDASAGSTLKLLRTVPKPEAVSGLRSARIGLATPMRTSFFPKPRLDRVGLVAFWDSPDALDTFEAVNPIGQAFAGGFSMRLAPLRMHGSWPGADPDLPKSRRVDYDGPAAVLTLGRTKFSQLPRFLRTSLKAEQATANAPGLLWATALARPPFVSTCSLWESSDAIAEYAFNHAGAGHPSAIDAGKAKPFHHEEAFIRFRPIASSGHLDGINPLREGILA